MSKHKSIVNKALSWVKDYWIIITLIGGAISAAAIFPFKLANAESDIKALKEQTTAIYSWVKQEQTEKEFEKERIASAPPGYYWDTATRQYLETK